MLASAGIFCLSVLLLSACKTDSASASQEPPAQTKTQTITDADRQWPGTQQHEMTNETGSLRLPKVWERSTRAVLASREMSPAREKAHELMQIAIKQLAPDENVIDVWEADVQNYHAIISINTDTIPLVRSRVTALSRDLQANYAYMDEITEDTKITIEDSSFKENATHQVAKFKYKFEREGSVAYLCTFFATIPTRSFIIYELAEEKSDIEQYLYSLQ